LSGITGDEGPSSEVTPESLLMLIPEPRIITYVYITYIFFKSDIFRGFFNYKKILNKIIVLSC
jgi:hypothetical protein